MKRVLSLISSCMGNSVPHEQAYIYWRLGNLALNEKKYRHSDSNYNAALEMFDIIYGPSTHFKGAHFICADIQIQLGIIHYEEHDNIRALERLEEAMGTINKVAQNLI